MAVTGILMGIFVLFFIMRMGHGKTWIGKKLGRAETPVGITLLFTGITLAYGGITLSLTLSPGDDLQTFAQGELAPNPGDGYLSASDYYVTTSDGPQLLQIEPGAKTEFKTIPSDEIARYEIQGYYPVNFTSKFTTRDTSGRTDVVYTFYIPASE